MACGRSRRQLGGWACQTGPRLGFRARQLESTKAPIERLLSGAEVVDNGAKLPGDQGARDCFSLAPHGPTILRLDFGEVLPGADHGTVERELETAIPVARPLVPSGRGGILRARHESTIGVKLSHRGEAGGISWDRRHHCVRS